MTSDDFQVEVNAAQELNQAESGLDSSLNRNSPFMDPSGGEATSEAGRPLEATPVSHPGFSFVFLLTRSYEWRQCCANGTGEFGE